MQGVESSEGRPYHGVPYREHSFLTNTRLAPRIRDSNVSVHFVHSADLAPRVTTATYGASVNLPRGATDVEVLRALGPGTAHDQTAVVYLDDAEDVLGGFEDAARGSYIRSLLDQKVLYGSWCCSRTNFHMPGATAFFARPPNVPTGAQATEKRLEREKRPS